MGCDSGYDLTPRARELLGFLSGCEVCPTFDEMRAALGLASKSGVARLLRQLEARGYVRRLARSERAISVVRPLLSSLPDREGPGVGGGRSGSTPLRAPPAPAPEASFARHPPLAPPLQGGGLVALGRFVSLSLVGQLFFGMALGAALAATLGASALAIAGLGLILSLGARLLRRRSAPSPPRFRDTSITALPTPADRPGFRGGAA